MASSIGRVGIWSNGLRYSEDRAAIADAAAELEQLGYDALFLPDVGGDVLGDVEHVLDATREVAVVTGILNIWMHDAGAIAAGIADLETRHPGRFTVGLGASHAAVVDAEGREPRYGRPLSAMKAYLDGLDAGPTPVPQERRILAALGPKMLELSRDRAGGAHPYLVPVQHTRIARETLGPDRLLAPEVSVVLDDDPASGFERARAFVADYLALPNYVNNLLRLGFTEQDVADGGSERLVKALVAYGDEEAIAAGVAEHHAAGADHVAVQVVGVPNGTLQLDIWRRIAPALVSAA
ncbi:LLM class F420-dependent oxidoreductase [Conexibacter sp. CPCC 206217]|uniref:LLM class F420-dependent oxidoreductase n=1 Tax=Conexibacter sp. CPCC 206217 TaxID=3064574 RepID=UPI002715AC9F|nr:LLM class F420-dependent oxidoreductase [Conexibacter sp. CPCC 206217]MDO8211149.1 LLM class F420-dependent oxidoreductase [Conexibacter sp. CPCC 206217]